MASAFQGFRSLIENSPDAISLIDTQGEVLYASLATAKIFGYQPEEVVGQNCLDLIHPEDRDHSSQALQEVLAKPPGPVQWHARVRRKHGGYAWVENTISNLLFENEVQAVVVNQRDIGTSKDAEARRQKDAEKMVRLNAELEGFAFATAHDLREPLRSISLCTELLIQKAQLDADSRKMAEFIVESAARMSIVVDDLLSFASTGTLEPPQWVDLQEAVTQARQNLRLLIEANGATITADPLPVVQGPRGHLVRVFQNLMSNAILYRSEDPVSIHVTAERSEQGWVAKVKDNGIGIAPAYQDSIFFKRLHDRDAPGAGLGLAICKKIVERLGGTIWVESQLGAGSTFCFTIAEAREE